MTPRRSRSVLPVGVSAPPAEGGREPEPSRATGEAGVPAMGERVVVPAVGVWAASRRGSISVAGSGRLRWGGVSLLAETRLVLARQGRPATRSPVALSGGRAPASPGER